MLSDPQRHPRHDPVLRPGIHNQLGERPGELLKQIKEKLNTEDQKLLWKYHEEWIMPLNRQDEIILFLNFNLKNFPPCPFNFSLFHTGG